MLDSTQQNRNCEVTPETGVSQFLTRRKRNEEYIQVADLVQHSNESAEADALDPKECHEWWIGGEGNGVAVMIGSPQNEK